jgi:hypothetical protein
MTELTIGPLVFEYDERSRFVGVAPTEGELVGTFECDPETWESFAAVAADKDVPEASEQNLKPADLARSLGIQLWTPSYRKGKGVGMDQTDDGAYIHISDLHRLRQQQPEGRELTLYICPVAECGYLSMAPGKCRSHPYPCRAMGPQMVEVKAVIQGG